PVSTAKMRGSSWASAAISARTFWAWGTAPRWCIGTIWCCLAPRRRQAMSSAEAIDISALMEELGCRARKAARVLASTSAERKYAARVGAAHAVRDRREESLAANAIDMENARAKGMTAAFQDRRLLTEARLDGIADALRAIAELPDPVGSIISEWDRPNGLHIERVRTPLGVIGVIYESRPN